MVACRLVVACLAIVFEVVMGAVLVDAATLTVRRQGVGQFDRLQAAVDAAASGDTIDVGPGVYTDFRSIRLGGGAPTDIYVHVAVDDLTIIGAGADQTIIGPPERHMGDDFYSPKIIWAGDSSRLNVHGLTIRNGQTGIFGPDTLTTVDNCNFAGNDFGITLNSQRADIADCGFTGLDLNSMASSPQGDAEGMFDYFLPPAIGVEEGWRCEFSRVRHCRFVRAGITIADVEDFAVSGCLFSDPRCAIRVGGRGSTGIISGCSIANARDNAISIDSGVCTVADVEIVGGVGGIAVSVAHVVAESVTIRQTTGQSLFLCAPEALAVHHSNLLPASGYSVRFIDGPTPPGRVYDMRGNYWGTADGAAIAAAIWDRHDSARIDDEILYEPFTQEMSVERKSLGAVDQTTALAASAIARGFRADRVSPIRRYDVEVRPSPSEVSVEGRARIEFNEMPAERWPVRFPRHDLVVQCLNIDGVAAISTGDSTYIEIPRCRSAEIIYSARPRVGLEFAGKTLHTVFSTAHWMPCLEDPSVRAPLTLTLVSPDSVEAVANGRLVSRGPWPATAGSDPLIGWRFELDAPYPSYLYGFAVGPLVRETAQCGEVELVAAGEGVAPEALRRLLDETAKMMTFLAERAGVPYPLASYTQVVVPGGAAQEMAGFSVLGLDGLQEMLADAPDSTAGPVEDWLPVHELSHAWWGNAITCRDWSHFWLNEGFAVFMTAAWKQHRWGEAGYQVELERAQARWTKAREAGADHPLAYAGDYPSRGLRNAIVYSKAALFLAELRRELGDDLFWLGVRAYTRSCLGQSVVSADFEQAMVGATQRDLRPLFAGWVDAPASAP